MSPSARDPPSAEARRSLVASGSEFHLVRWLPLARHRARGLSRLPAAGGAWSRPFRRSGQVADRTVVAPFSFEIRKSTEEIAQRGRVAGAQRPAGLSLQPHRLRLGTRGAARSFFAELERAEQQGPDLLRAVAAARASLGPIETALSHGARRSDDGCRRSSPTSWPRRSRAGVADAGVMRGEPARAAESPARRRRARHGPGLHPHLRRSHRPGGGGRTNSTIPSGNGRSAASSATFYQPTVCPISRSPPRAGSSFARAWIRSSTTCARASASPRSASRSPRSRAPSSRPCSASSPNGAAVTRLLRGAAGALLYNALVMAAFWLLIFFYRRRTYDRLREMCVLRDPVRPGSPADGGAYSAFPGRPELVPIPFATIVVTLLYSGQVGVAAA